MTKQKWKRRQCIAASWAHTEKKKDIVGNSVWALYIRCIKARVLRASLLIINSLPLQLPCSDAHTHKCAAVAASYIKPADYGVRCIIWELIAIFSPLFRWIYLWSYVAFRIDGKKTVGFIVRRLVNQKMGAANYFFFRNVLWKIHKIDKLTPNIESRKKIIFTWVFRT